jgi:Family of unknown function (DUF5685)
VAHLCGLCLALRDDHGQLSRFVTNYDGLIVSALVEAQSPDPAGGRRTAGPCPLRGMRSAEVARGEGARLAAAVSLVLASAKMRDHVADRDGVLARRPVAAAARKVAARWDRAGALTGADLGFDTAVLVRAIDRQPEIEAATVTGGSLLAVTEPTETATAAAFGHTAVLAGRPGNRAPLEEAGRLFGRLAHLLDAVEDRAEDMGNGAWNPLIATGTGLAETRRLCDDALHGIKLALRDVDFADGKLVHVLLVHELRQSVDRAFGTTRHICAHGDNTGHQPLGSDDRTPGQPVPGGIHASGGPVPGNPYAPGNPNDPNGPVPNNPYAPGGPGAPTPPPGRRHNQLIACVIWAGLCLSCQACCRKQFNDPCSGRSREGCCYKCDCATCCDGFDCCDCCECGDCCDCDC